jgi:thioredoxin reductase (NADPH)
MLSVDELRKIPLFSSLLPKELDYLARTVPDIRVERGDYVAHEGDSPCLVVVVEGELEVTKIIDGEERVLGDRVPGELYGEPTVVLNVPCLASLRAVQTSRVIRIEPRVFHALAAAAPEVAATVAREALGRVGGLQDLAQSPVPVAVRLIGPNLLPSVYALRDFLHRNQVEFEWLAPEDPVVRTLPLGPEGSSGRYPLALLADGTVLVDPSFREIAQRVGLSVTPNKSSYEIVIVGAGPAGLSAAVYGAADGNSTLLVERYAPGGQAGTSSRIENYLGFPVGVSGDELAARALRQARRLGAEIVVTRSVERIDVLSKSLTLDGGDVVHAGTIILAMGVTWRRLSIEGLDRLTGRGVYYGAVRTAAGGMEGRDVYLIGAGNSAGQAAVFFSSYARSVTLVVRGDDLEKSMSHYLVVQLQGRSNIRFELSSEVVAVHGGDHLEALDIASRATGTTRKVDAAGLFIFIGADAATDWLPTEIARDARGYVLTGPDAVASGRWTAPRPPSLLETTVPGVFAAGDVRSSMVKRAAAAVGDGGLASSFADQYMQELARL